MTFKRTMTALTVAGLAAVAAAAIPPAEARPFGSGGRDGQQRGSGTPLFAVVALAEQHITVYDRNGNRMLQAPVSSGNTGYETPAGIYSVVQKEEEHHSNLYEDGSMPFMQRFTWTGMALHAGVLPGYPASHGCVRLPHAFADQLYQLTSLGMRLIILREDIAPVEVSQPAMFKPGAAPTPDMAQLTAAARAKAADADATANREKETRLGATRKAAEAAAATRSLRAAESNLARAEADLKAAERAAEKAASTSRAPQAEEAKTKAAAKVETARAQVQTAKAQADAKTEAAARAEEEAQAAATAKTVAAEAAEEAKQNLAPVSVFISRKTQRLYIRKANYPVFEAPVVIRNADKPLGSFVFTALSAADGSGALRWNVVSMYKNATDIEPYGRVAHGKAKTRRADPPPPADAAGAEAALARIELMPDAAGRIAAVVLPGSSLIISDEGPSIETGKDTDFVVIMSGEPQGGIAIRRHEPIVRNDGYDDGYAPWGYSRGRRSTGGGFPFFFSE